MITATATGPAPVTSADRLAALSSAPWQPLPSQLPEGIVVSLDEVDDDEPIYEGDNFLESIAFNISIGETDIAKRQITLPQNKVTDDQLRTVIDYLANGFDWKPDRAKAAIEEMRGRPLAAPPADKPKPFKVVTYGEAKAQLNLPYIVKGFLHPLEMSALIGAPGCGKTFLALDLCAHIAAGKPWMGHKVKQMPVCYLAAEGGTAILNRIAAMKERGFAQDIPLAVIMESLDLRSDASDTLALAKLIDDTSAKFRKPVGLIVIDTVSRVLAGGDENSPEDMGALIRNVDRLRDTAAVHAMLVHHNTKEGGTGKGGRGHSSLWGALDCEIDVKRDPATKIATATVYKQRNGAEGGKASFQLEMVNLGNDNDDEPVTSCIVQPTDAALVKAGDMPMSTACKIILGALHQAVDEGGVVPPANNHIPAGKRVTTVKLWRQYAYQKDISAGDDDAKQKAFKRAAGQLQAKEIVSVWNDYVWATIR